MGTRIHRRAQAVTAGLPPSADLKANNNKFLMYLYEGRHKRECNTLSSLALLCSLTNAFHGAPRDRDGFPSSVEEDGDNSRKSPRSPVHQHVQTGTDFAQRLRRERPEAGGRESPGHPVPPQRKRPCPLSRVRVRRRFLLQETHQLLE